jgi:hypothetical protein
VTDKAKTPDDLDDTDDGVIATLGKLFNIAKKARGNPGKTDVTGPGGKKRLRAIDKAIEDAERGSSEY